MTMIRSHQHMYDAIVANGGVMEHSEILGILNEFVSITARMGHNRAIFHAMLVKGSIVRAPGGKIQEYKEVLAERLLWHAEAKEWATVALIANKLKNQSTSELEYFIAVPNADRMLENAD